MKSSNQRGFTLIEAVMASAILALVTGGIVSLLNITMRAGATTEVRIQAYELMQAAFEYARNDRDTTWIDGTPNNWDSKFVDPFPGPITVGNNEFTVETTFSDVNPPEPKKKVDVIVSDAKGKKLVNGSTILTNWIKP